MDSNDNRDGGLDDESFGGPPLRDVTSILQSIREEDKPDRVKELREEFVVAVLERLRTIVRQQRFKVGAIPQPFDFASTDAVVSEFFIEKLDKLLEKDTVTNTGEVVAFSTTVIRRMLLTELRKRKTQLVSLSDSFEADGDKRHSIEHDLQKIEALEQVRSCVKALDERYSAVVDCRIWGGLSHETTAKYLGISEGLVRKRWGRAKDDVARCLRNLGGGA